MWKFVFLKKKKFLEIELTPVIVVRRIWVLQLAYTLDTPIISSLYRYDSLLMEQSVLRNKCKYTCQSHVSFLIIIIKISIVKLITRRYHKTWSTN